ncbi:PorP/SprF family type IX secretion system membrane protein, partial [Lishizhenia sp.]|uniref:PorP/SprF family type IX secretion system membrane protein n=1 Tax=Lishizhenia sp. TaxID=2497594 RepID=UPI00299D93C8
MKRNRGVELMLMVLTVLMNFTSWSQDIHFSQFDYNPVFQNPGNVGQFTGDLRFHFNYKDQWRRVTVPFQTTSISVEARVKKIDGLALGAYLFHDVVGDGSLRTFEFVPSVSYLWKLTPDSTHSIRPGFQIGINNRSLQFDQFYFDNQFNGIFFDPSLPTGENLGNLSKTNVTIGAGIVYEFYMDERNKITAGSGLFNINRPNQGFIGPKVQRDMRFNLMVRYQRKLDPDWDILPSLQFNAQGKYKELIFGAQAKYYLENRNGIYKALYGGLYLRNRDAMYLVLGMDWQNIWAGISYDINVSQLVPASNARGGLELSFRYILTRFKPKNIKHRV